MRVHGLPATPNIRVECWCHGGPLFPQLFLSQLWKRGKFLSCPLPVRVHAWGARVQKLSVARVRPRRLDSADTLVPHPPFPPVLLPSLGPLWMLFSLLDLPRFSAIVGSLVPPFFGYDGDSTFGAIPLAVFHEHGVWRLLTQAGVSLLNWSRTRPGTISFVFDTCRLAYLGGAHIPT